MAVSNSLEKQDITFNYALYQSASLSFMFFNGALSQK